MAQRNTLLLTTTPSLQSKVSYIFCEKPIHLTTIYATCLAMVLRHLRNKLLGWSYTVQDSCNCNSQRMRRGLAKIKVLITRLMSTNRYEASCWIFARGVTLNNVRKNRCCNCCVDILLCSGWGNDYYNGHFILQTYILDMYNLIRWKRHYASGQTKSFRKMH